jgi:hypothetical protein
MIATRFLAGIAAFLLVGSVAFAGTNYSEDFEGAEAGWVTNTNCNQNDFTVGNFLYGPDQSGFGAPCTSGCAESGGGGAFTRTSERAHTGSYSWRRVGKATSGNTPRIELTQSVAAWDEIWMDCWLYVPPGNEEPWQKFMDPSPNDGPGNFWLEYMPSASIDGTKYYATRCTNGVTTVFACKAFGTASTTPSSTVRATATCDAGGSGTLLKDADGAFNSKGLVAGDLAFNESDGSFARIVSWTNTQVTTEQLRGGTANTWGTGERYEIVPINSGRYVNLPKGKWNRLTLRVITRAGANDDTLEVYLNGIKRALRGGSGATSSDTASGTLYHNMTTYNMGTGGWGAVHWFLSSADADCSDRPYYLDDIYVGQDPPPGISLDVTPPQVPVGVQVGP